MSVCRSFVAFGRRHPWLGNLFILLSIAILFGGIWWISGHHGTLLAWLNQDPLLHYPLAIATLLGLSLVIFLLLSLAGACLDEDQEACFRTFSGRRSGASVFRAFNHWLHHMEHVSKKHR